MSGHSKFSVDTGVPGLLLRPRSPWQCGSRREHQRAGRASTSPEATSMAGYTQADLDAVAPRLNGRPRQTVGWKTRPQILAQALQ